jgi:hypothetical protein
MPLATDISDIVIKLKREHKEILAFELPLHAKRKTVVSPFLFRPLTVREFEEYTRLGELGDVSDEIIEATIIYPALPFSENPVQQLSAGIYEGLAFQIVLASGLTDPKEAKVMDGRQAARKFTAVVEMFICKAFPKYAPDDVKNMTLDQQMELLGQAEHLLGIEFPVKDFFGKPQVAESYVPKDFGSLQSLSDGDIERITEGAISREALAQVAKRANSPEDAMVRRQELKAKIARQRQLEGD